MNNNSNNLRIGNLFGIPFFINPSWFFVLGLITLQLGTDFARYPQLTGVLPWLVGLLGALLLFASVLAHELGHSFAAISQGIQVKSITLFIFGGLATLEKESETPLQSLLVAIAGPLVSVLLFIVFTIIGVNLQLDASLTALIYLLAQINLVLALFNMIPGLPLDGGNVLKAIVWKITGNPNKGIIFAGRVGQFFGWVAVGFGVLGVLGISQVGSFWTLLIGWFLLQNAGMAAQSATVQDKLDHYTAEDAVITDSPIISGNLSLREFVNNFVIGKKQWKKFLVVNENNQLQGNISLDDLKQISTSQWNDVLVGELVRPIEQTMTIANNTSLLEVVKLIETQQVKEEIVVVNEEQMVIGLLDKISIFNLLQKEALEKANKAQKNEENKPEQVDFLLK
ncbi:Zn-dependent protease [Xenococcus sp. PCC 7305]|uniref:site-2 protease family protein n=1 Tax=Xenococcus sp. PCC 7305 TaxID=102125 RepID=UPI0002AD17BE|nr:site-2 protease family protein [Xenococcus sp. PCC 7305]ELS02324.1 Zn-dependent protease [Xenococcus sp. PCC 7305]